MPILEGNNKLQYVEFKSKFFRTPKRDPVGVFRYFVYGWYREGIYLYIGMTTNGRRRFFGHHIFKHYRVRQTDRAHVWICKDGAEALELETQLIQEFDPCLNVRKKRRTVFLSSHNIYVPRLKDKKIITITKKNEVIAKPSQGFAISDWHEVTRLQALAACQNQKDYKFVNHLISRGLI